MAKFAKEKAFTTWITKNIIAIVGVVLTIVGIFNAIISNSLAESNNMLVLMELERAEFARPIIYEFIFEYRGTKYEIRYGDTVKHIPAKELTIDVTMGALTSIVVFHYDGQVLHYRNNFVIPSYGIAEPTVTMRMPSNPGGLIYNGVFYDYMFLLMVPVQGNSVLYMLCVEVDIDSGMLLRTERFDRYSLLELTLNASVSDARRHMLEAYYKLISQIANLPNLSWS